MNFITVLVCLVGITSQTFCSTNLPEHSMPQQTPQFTFKRITPPDLPLLLTWFKEPHVAKWWPVPEKDQTIEHFLEKIRSKDTFAYFAMLNGTPIGYIQYYLIDRSNDKAGSWLPDLPATTVGTDQFIGDPNYIGKGYGTLLVKEFIQYLAHTLAPGTTTVIVDPEPTNVAAIRCYEKVGFTAMGNYTTPWGPALLMRYDIKP